MSKVVLNPHYFRNVGNNYKSVTENVGCKVSHHMTNPQPTDKGSDTEIQKPSENLSQPWNIIAEVLHNCSEEAREEFASQLDQKLQELEGENN
jgi:hypothetical protein